MDKLTEEQLRKLEELVLEKHIEDYEEICTLVGGRKPPIRAAIKKFFEVVDIRKCPECGKEIVVYRSLPHKKFCCEEHKKKYFNSHRSKDKKCVCQYCGKEFMTYSFRESKYCSNNCASLAR